MRINIEQSKDVNETEITIKCQSQTEEVERIISAIQLLNHTITGKAEGKTYFVKLEDILYFDTVDERVFIYTKNKVYETGLRLYEIEEKFADTSVIRVSKSSILNLMKVEQITPLLNGRIKAILQNEESIIISRQYIHNFKKKLGI
ncbi:LytTR family DNA-binding domain-containing protein [Anaerocolumna sp. MB42-C2]|uniref:LytTR family DNA-binding domain-containing protein n=1 Tax=Anaerocolumna sp. MB42-C2 TaxID=3070997 RepID=UPI0027DEEFFA|nr:LytTR family DNA-binding domain-containing protein [Anaerocolumna sp. MB42-C2]WMJ89315.1 LytTR family DNA-binding domain-containing protein [Anaerocolumna sp. MB42-C2]